MKIASIWPVLLALVLTASGGAVRAAEPYPSRNVYLIVTAAAGGPVDLLARQFAQKLSERWGNATMVAENRGGAGGFIAMSAVSKAAPDGHTLLFGSSSSITMARYLYHSPPIDPVTDLAPIARVAASPMVLVINPRLPANSLAELIQLLKAKPGQLNVCTMGGMGTGPTVATEVFKLQAAVSIVDVNYRSVPQCQASLMTGETAMLFDTPAVLSTLVKAGKMRALAVTSKSRMSLAPEVPTVEEAGGLPGFEFVIWYGFYGPPGLERSVIAKLGADLDALIKSRDLQERLVPLGYEIQKIDGAELARLIRSETERWAKHSRETNWPKQ